MIGQVSGILIDKQLPWVVIETQGLGYDIQVPMTTGLELPALGQSVILFTQFIVREDAQLLYGFHTKSLREIFRQLIKVNGIGPKIALAILSGLDEISLKRCIVNKDISGLSQLPGIGKKTAERLVVELQDKLDSFEINLSSGSNKNLKNLAGKNNLVGNSPMQEAMGALISLGYKPQEAKRLLDLESNSEDLEKLSAAELIRRALKAVMKTS